MKFKKLALLTLSLALSPVYAYSTNLVVGTYNIDAKVVGEHESQKNLMQKDKVEIFGLQEINYKNERFADKNIHNYNPLNKFVDSFYKYSYYGNAVKFANGGYGIATISHLPLKNEETIQLVLNDISKKYAVEFEEKYNNYNPTKPESVKAMDSMWEKDGIAKQGVMEPRVYTRVVVNKEGIDIAFYNTHLSFESRMDRAKQMQQIIDAMSADNIKYQILVGDFNTDQSTKEWDVWREKFNLANGAEHIFYDTFIGEDPDMNVNSVDNIIVSKNIKIISIYRISSTLSDHVPLIAELEFK